MTDSVQMTDNITLRDVEESDLPIFFNHHRDPDANYMAAFTAKDPSDEAAFRRQWAMILGDKSIICKTILFDGQIVGHVMHFNQFGNPAVSYWLDKAYWGRGITTRALQHFLTMIATRPLYARAAKDNAGSIRVLQKCGFVIVGEDEGFANARNATIEEWILRLD